MSVLMPAEEQRCTKRDGKGWRCKSWKKQGRTYCDKHFLQMVNSNKKKNRIKNDQVVNNNEKNESMPITSLLLLQDYSSSCNDSCQIVTPRVPRIESRTKKETLPPQQQLNKRKTPLENDDMVDKKENENTPTTGDDENSVEKFTQSSNDDSRKHKRKLKKAKRMAKEAEELETFKSSCKSSMETLKKETKEELENFKSSCVDFVEILKKETKKDLEKFKSSCVSFVETSKKETKEDSENFKSGCVSFMETLKKETKEALENFKNFKSSYESFVETLKKEVENEALQKDIIKINLEEALEKVSSLQTEVAKAKAEGEASGSRKFIAELPYWVNRGYLIGHVSVLKKQRVPKDDPQWSGFQFPHPSQAPPVDFISATLGIPSHDDASSEQAEDAVERARSESKASKDESNRIKKEFENFKSCSENSIETLKKEVENEVLQIDIMKTNVEEALKKVSALQTDLNNEVAKAKAEGEVSGGKKFVSELPYWINKGFLFGHVSVLKKQGVPRDDPRWYDVPFPYPSQAPPVEFDWDALKIP